MAGSRINGRGTQPDARALIYKKLEQSLLDEADAKSMRLKPADITELKGHGLPEKRAFEIPYFDFKGRPSGFKRWRYLEDTRDGFAALTDAKPVRYVQPPDTVSEVYLPPFADWEAVATDTTQGIVITEGELKAACVTKHVAPCVGLGGVYSFKSVKRRLPLLQAFYEFEWTGRDVVVAFDSDARSNPMVAAARNELCRELMSLGALPRVADVPPAADGAKQGVDDLALASGVDALRLCLDAAEPFATSQALHELNAEVAYVRDPGLVVELTSGRKMRAADFTGHAYANRHYYEVVADANGNERLAKKQAAPAWLKWPLRAELGRVVYEPGEQRVTQNGDYNSWTGWAVEPKRGDITPWKKLLDHLFTGHPVERKWFEQWCAMPLQRVGCKQYSCAVLWGRRTGTGKSLVGYSLGRIYGENFTEIGDHELEDAKCAWAACKQFVLGDDVTGQEQRKYSERLKKMITQEKIRIDIKYVPSYTVRDLINYLFTSNHPDAFFLEDDDRRYFVHEVTADPMAKQFYTDYVAWLDNGGAAALFDHLLRLDLTGRDPSDRAPHTNARDAMIEDGLSEMGRWVRRLRDDPSVVLRLGGAELTGDLWSAADLLRLYDPDGRGRATSGGLGKELKRAGIAQACGGMPVRTAAGQNRLFAVRDAGVWTKAEPSAAAKHYAATRLPSEKIKKFSN